MKEYTTAQVAQKLDKSERTIRKAAQVAEKNGRKIGRKIGRDWIFTDADIAKIEAIKIGAPRGRRKKATQPAQPQEPT